MRRVAAMAVMLSLMSAARGFAQSPADSAVLAPVHRFFEGMRTRDTALIRTVVTPDATMLSAGGASGVGQRITANDFIRAVGTAKGDAWNERIFDPIVRIDGPFASVWTRYTFQLGEKFLHCGVNAIQLVDVAGAWKVRHLSDSRRTTGCTEAAPQDEAPAALAMACRAAGLALVFLLAPTSTPERIALVAARSSGFIYLVSVTGITGARQALPSDLQAFVRRVRAVTAKPLAVGFGISTPAQARSVGQIADGVIVGSALINAAGASQEAVPALRTFVSSLHAALAGAA